ncbi:DMT family transporter [Paenibacillus paeoniae]|uniref:QacE family quaternary ammonium compound efflux SMR transporter n=1 Tax=Paenibacillus paeoniae TaxID=2292705 RepID=A0A371PL08_9BACL|nr:multidrug efflux SMR transporter [Paenibacillus paeoniae]REK76878.1 QacE family quaternary ammonium compound efflux SMR transporter [Paenibacillus paeoniae]
MRGYIYLTISILIEAFAASMLKVSEGFSLLLPTIASLSGYLVAFIFLSITMRTIALSKAYATWAGAGTALTVLIGITFFQESTSLLKLAGVAVIIIGLFILNTSKGNEKATSTAA